ncbi:hypothetical protein A3H10_00800 [Candidatus Uhrbacteria bacterium RIFCSPLOWO2_12_FULL_46_10]|uniref:DUF86 domain-containing protein n=1 Tax=Candidatus Uhrbacteria bacterium RIFCSPLOWO2_01_FULL_47_25 TaxID=1802402 RepID=A0A1F7URW6_9BACT|nr:MAG: hypothetical protein UX68_C0005G0021 [Parcubacteria group bacterium GW2011_GWA2_46_9]OGL60627.1 MAG: hypothetical protein A2752_02260 [Candidatus Uhrbacteria bacterium RIFCSPHIGHO2_01_FULL_46_23]OGL68134.1 MAG: hypothetical protein A3D60_03975 [Candidatus Uhrbacteria bacterium RIFCSPHIGHO2_02_FULL_47_29]OGL74821.1 MAG: hypothetical protein A3E96_04710 [Candidatus Uhrbacteria bacterium RIFCSPHIGHO2_12_FULL_46_13]OGL80985.1 MAG: hypothetical protein A2936_03310 [Candidatus Uhrbacteria bac
MTDRDQIYIKHILDAIATIEGYISGISAEDFYANKLCQDGVTRELEIMGEAVKRLSPECTASMVSVPWKDIARMRDKLIHDYISVDLDAVWKTATVDVVALKKVLLDSIRKFE